MGSKVYQDFSRGLYADKALDKPVIFKVHESSDADCARHWSREFMNCHSPEDPCTYCDGVFRGACGHYISIKSLSDSAIRFIADVQARQLEEDHKKAPDVKAYRNPKSLPDPRVVRLAEEEPITELIRAGLDPNEMVDRARLEGLFRR